LHKITLQGFHNDTPLLKTLQQDLQNHMLHIIAITANKLDSLERIAQEEQKKEHTAHFVS
jgi:hypothetical protein